MIDPIAQLCKLIVDKLRDEPEVSQAELIEHLEGVIITNPELEAALKKNLRMRQDNQDGAKGFQFTVEDDGRVFIEGTHYHFSDPQKILAVLRELKLSKSEMIDFRPYLQSLTSTYKNWQKYYTFTDAIGKTETQEPVNPTLFDFGLEVQTVTEEEESTFPESDDPSPENRESTERLPVLEGIRKYANDHVLLIGRPGSGKSTALIRLLHEMATQAVEQQTDQVPILIELRYWQTDLLSRIQAFINRHDPDLNLDDANLTNLLLQGRFCLLIDGLNELPSEEARSHLATFRRDYPKVPMIFTTRDLVIGGDMGIEKKLEMQAMTETQMQAFIRAYIPEQADAMLTQLNNRLREFGKTPLLLWMLCKVFQESPGNQLPYNLAGVFKAFTTMYEVSSVRQHEVALLKGDVRPLSDRRLWKKALIALASVMMKGKTPVDFRVVIDRNEVERELSKIFPNERFQVQDILDDLLKYHLLQNHDVDQIEFHHQLIQEYYAAEHLLQLLPELNDEQLKLDYLNYLKWTEPIALMLSLLKEQAQALQVVKLAMDEVDFMLGARFAGEVNQELQVSTISSINKLEVPLKFKIRLLGLTNSFEAVKFLKPFLEEHDEFIKIEVLKALDKIGDTSSIAFIREALRDTNQEIRWWAASRLGIDGDETAIPTLQEFLCLEKHHLNAITVIEKIDPEKVIPLLGETIKHRNPDVRLKATQSLHILLNRGHEGILPFLEIALQDQDGRVRRSAAHALKDLDSEESVSMLSQAWADDDILVQALVCDSINNNVEKYLEADLIESLLGRNSHLKKQAIEIIKRTKTNSETLVESLLNIVFFESDFLIRNNASTALILIGNSIVIQALGKILEEEDIETRKYSSKHSEAVCLLLQICNRDSIPILTKVLADNCKTFLVRKLAIKALGEIGDPSIVHNLLEHLVEAGRVFEASNNLFQFEHIYVETILAFGKLGVDDLEDSIIKIFDTYSNSPDIQEDCVNALAKIYTDKSKLALKKALENNEFSVRFGAALALANQQCTDSIPVLLEALGYRSSGFEDTAVSSDAINALCELGEIVISALQGNLDNQDFQIRNNARKAIEKIRGIQEVDSFSEILENSSTGDYLHKLIYELTKKYGFADLCDFLSTAESDDAWKFSSALREISQPEQLCCLNNLILESDSNNVFKYVPGLILSIQNRCMFYNYKIWQTTIQNQKPVNLAGQLNQPSHGELLTKIDQTTQQINQRTEQMASEPNNDLTGATFNAPVNFGDNPKGDFIGTQNHYASDPEVQNAISELQFLLTQLQSQHPQVETEVEAMPIIDAEFIELKRSQTNKFAILRKQIFTLERHAQAMKATFGEVAKHYMEESVWAKAVITYLDKMSETPDQEA